MNWLKKLFGNCKHEYKVIQEAALMNIKDSLQLLQCAKCGDEKGIIVTRTSTFSPISKVEPVNESSEWILERIAFLKKTPHLPGLFEPGENSENRA